MWNEDEKGNNRQGKQNKRDCAVPHRAILEDKRL